MNRKCLVCGNEFQVNRKDKMTCSTKCSSTLSVKRSRGGYKKNKAKDDGNLRMCSNCFKWKDKENGFNIINNYYLNICKDCNKENRRTKNSELSKEDVYKQVEFYVLRMKAKKFMADQIDIFKLVDIYDKLWPNKQSIPNMSGYQIDYEKSCMTMFERIARWYKTEKDILEAKSDIYSI